MKPTPIQKATKIKTARVYYIFSLALTYVLLGHPLSDPGRCGSQTFGLIQYSSSYPINGNRTKL